jgi:hypothetical protein
MTEFGTTAYSNNQRTQSDAAANVLQALSVPSLKPVVNQRLRCSDEPWVKLSGPT